MPVYKSFDSSGRPLYSDRPGSQLSIPMSLEGLGASDSTDRSSTYISPDSESADDILAGAKQTLSKVGPVGGSHAVSAEDFAPQRTWGDTAASALKGAGKGVLDSLYGMGHAILHPIDTLGDLTEARERLSEKAINAPTTSEKIGYGVASGIPIFGPMLAGLGEEIGTGDPEHIGHAVGEIGTAAALPEVLPRSVRALGDATEAIRGADLGAPIRGAGRVIERTGSAIKNTLGPESKIGGKLESASPYAFISGHPAAGVTGMFGPSLAGKLGELGEFLGGKMKTVGEEAPAFERHAPNVSGYPSLAEVRASLAQEAPSSGPSLAGPQVERYAPNASGYPSLDEVKTTLAREGTIGRPSPEDLGISGSGHFRSGSNLPGAMLPTELMEPEVPQAKPYDLTYGGQVPDFQYFGETTGRPGELPPPRSSTLFSPQEEPTAADVESLVGPLLKKPAEPGATLPPSIKILERGDEFWGPGSKTRSGETSMADESSRMLYDPQTPTKYLREQLAHATTPQDRDFLVRALRQRYNINSRAAGR